MIDKVKMRIEDLKDKEVYVKVNVGRNKYEYYEGKVAETYPYLFTIKSDNLMKSFTYSDILTKDVQLKVK